MNYCTLLTISFFFCLFLTNVVYEYVHVLNSKKRKSRQEEYNDKKKLFKFFLHIHILKQIVFESVINLAIKMSILLHVLKRYLTYSKKNYIGYLKNEDNHDVEKINNNNNMKKNNKKKKDNYNDNDNEKDKGNNNTKNYYEILENNNTDVNEIKIYNNNFIDNDYINYNNIYKTNTTNNLENKKNVQVKTIYFIRHSESVWNSVFNKELSTKQFLKMFMVILYELVFLFSKKSALIDSPLSNTGIIQSIELSNFLLEGRTDLNDEFCDETFNQIEYIHDKNKNNDNTMNDREYNNNNNNIDLYKLSKKKLMKNKNSLLNYNKNKETNDMDTTINNKNNNDDNNNNNNIDDDNNNNIDETQQKILRNVKSYITYDNNNVDDINNKNDNNHNNNNNKDEYNHEEIINLSLKDHIDILNNNKYESVLLCSDLRRTISSCFISFYNRINKNNEEIHVLNSLQEISRNPDCVPLMKYYNKYVTTDIEKFLHKDVEKLFRKNIKFNKNFTRNSFLDTLDYIFNHDKNIFIIFGHSLWFMNFFKYFLKESHKAKTSKLKNASILVFNVFKYENDNDQNSFFKVEEVLPNDHINENQNNHKQQHKYNNVQQQQQYNHHTNNISDTEYVTQEALTDSSDYFSDYEEYQEDEEDVTKADEQENFHTNQNEDIILHAIDNIDSTHHMENPDNPYEEDHSNITTKKKKKKIKLKNLKKKHKLFKNKNKNNKIFSNEKAKYEVDQNSIRVLYKGFDEKEYLRG
ncbi:conserved Plasmodium protein, unknown function [Plasmodium sp. gorilla clade G2]|uniref:conserved Plasmodium protein, unknown function n=1 Tax=Plasmodium sp. gorilla clade G2 TaxID=880535 RepID=UPI000D21B8BB|nr:conserved Plasmodium protein, unknown function [Plasmodium sp. gorilla clade G2]SOV18704.1 conserved Plasmodium protein, unknown function [Plasmodium sp. gorilla clade G2]